LCTIFFDVGGDTAPIPRRDWKAGLQLIISVEIVYRPAPLIRIANGF
jgi:hypothetical protein